MVRIHTENQNQVSFCRFAVVFSNEPLAMYNVQSKSLSVFKSNLHSIDLTKFLKGRVFNLS